MALPREVIPGTSYMITRRCSERRFFLLPDEGTTQNFFYCLGFAAEKFEIELLFTIANTNHHHTGIYDPFGRFPEFVQHFHKMLARCQNAHWGRHEAIWASEEVSVVELPEPADVLDKLIYALTNPVKDDLVDRAHQWPGASALGPILQGMPVVVARPADFFREGGRSPDTVAVRFHRPRGFESWTHEQWAGEIERRIEAVEVEASRRRQNAGRKVLGRKGVLRQSWKACPASTEFPASRRRARVSTSSSWARLAIGLRWKAFLLAYRQARDALMAGRLPIAFPEGTYWSLKPLPFKPVDLRSVG